MLHLILCLPFLVLNFLTQAQPLPDGSAVIENHLSVSVEMKTIKPLSYKYQTRKIRSYKGLLSVLPYLLIGASWAQVWAGVVWWLWPGALLWQLLLAGGGFFVV
ncbi:MAG: hypothetical protein HC880_18675, partial [Bacteroidia bacterium]|nr:hypothetical protein [Bacteroidia bacterium]